MNYFLGVDGGQSHTTALVADGHGRILGRGEAGPSNHAREPGGRERLIKAVTQSVGGALQDAGLLKFSKIPPEGGTTNGFKFASAHLAMTGEPEGKVEIIREILCAEHLVVGHDAPGALAGALAGGPGVIVLAGTGSVACGENREGKFARVGGHGYLFGDTGSGFAIASDALAMALFDEDRGRETLLKPALLKHFKRDSLKAIAEDVYAGILSRDRLASFAARIGKVANRKDPLSHGILETAAESLAEMAIATVLKLGLERDKRDVLVSYGGGVFNNFKVLTNFSDLVRETLPGTQIVSPRFGPDIGALLIAYRQAGKKITPKLLNTLTESKQ